MATKDRLLYSALHGTAWRHAAEQHNLAEAIVELHEMPMEETGALDARGLRAGDEVTQGRAVRPSGGSENRQRVAWWSSMASVQEARRVQEARHVRRDLRVPMEPEAEAVSGVALAILL